MDTSHLGNPIRLTFTTYEVLDGLISAIAVREKTTKEQMMNRMLIHTVENYMAWAERTDPSGIKTSFFKVDKQMETNTINFQNTIKIEDLQNLNTFLDSVQEKMPFLAEVSQKETEELPFSLTNHFPVLNGKIEPMYNVQNSDGDDLLPFPVDKQELIRIAWSLLRVAASI